MSAIIGSYHKIMFNRYITILVIIAIHSVASADSVIMPTTYLSKKDVRLTDLQEPVPQDVPAHKISLSDEDTTKKVEKNSTSFIIVNLNRWTPFNVTVTLTLNNSNLISFNKTSPKATKKLLFEEGDFGDRRVNIHTSDKAGHTKIICKVDRDSTHSVDNITIDDSDAYIFIDIINSPTLDVVIEVVGWIYFAAWSISFYFQVFLNYRRKSVVGLNFDFLALNTIGFVCYTVYNFALKFSEVVQNEYYRRHEYSRIPVEYNDLFFAAHAMLITLVTVAQCFIYEVSIAYQN